MADLHGIDGSRQGELDFGGNGINVVIAEYVDTVQTTWQELFYGFDEVYALTYSIGMNQVENLMENFKHGEVINIGMYQWIVSKPITTIPGIMMNLFLLI